MRCELRLPYATAALLLALLSMVTTGGASRAVSVSLPARSLTRGSLKDPRDLKLEAARLSRKYSRLVQLGSRTRLKRGSEKDRRDADASTGESDDQPGHDSLEDAYHDGIDTCEHYDHGHLRSLRSLEQCTTENFLVGRSKITDGRLNRLWHSWHATRQADRGL